MQFQVTFRHLEATDALKEYAERRMERFSKYFSDPIACHVTMTTEKYNHRVDVNLQLRNGFKIAGHETTENMYSSIDMVSAKIERQVRKYKDKLKHHKVRDMPAVPVSHSLISEADVVDREPEQAPPHSKPDVIKVEQMDAKALSVSEAIMQLNLLHEQFHVFRDADSGQICVVYRAGDEQYGLIETATAN